MQPFLMPMAYFPSMVVFIDNTHDVLMNVVLQLNEQLAYRFFDTSFEAFQFIQQKKRRSMLQRQCFSEHQMVLDLFREILSPQLSPLYAEILNPSRFSDISVILIDKSTQISAAIDFCRSIENRSIMKLVLIQAEDEVFAREAIANNYIDSYLIKQQNNLAELIDEQILYLQRQYFLKMSLELVKLLNLPASMCVYDLKFTENFCRLQQKYQWVEYYLADVNGCFIALDEDASLSIVDKTCAVNVLSEQGIHTKSILSYHRYLEELNADELLS